MSVPPFFALMMLFAKNATSDSPKFNPYPAIGWILCAASPINAILWEKYSSELVSVNGKANLLVLTSVIIGGNSNSKLFNYSGIKFPIETSEVSYKT